MEGGLPTMRSTLGLRAFLRRRDWPNTLHPATPNPKAAIRSSAPTVEERRLNSNDRTIPKGADLSFEATTLFRWASHTKGCAPLAAGREPLTTGYGPHNNRLRALQEVGFAQGSVYFHATNLEFLGTKISCINQYFDEIFG